MREISTRKTPNTNTFQAVCFKKRFLENILKKSVEKPQKCSTKILFWLFQNKYHKNTLNAVFIELQTYNLCYYSVKGLSCAFALFSLGTLFIPSSRIAFCMETSTEKKKILQTAQYTKTPSLASFWCFYCLLWAYLLVVLWLTLNKYMLAASLVTFWTHFVLTFSFILTHFWSMFSF